MKTQQAAAKVSAKVAAPKAAKNTPAKAAAKPATKTAVKPAAKAVTKPAAKAGVFALVAGTIAKIEHKHLKKAVAYHVAKGNLAKTTEGIKLTTQGAMLYNAERVAADPEKFQAIAQAMHAGATMIKEFNGQPVSQVNDKIAFPNMLYWGSFSTQLMRQAFAAIWAKQ